MLCSSQRWRVCSAMIGPLCAFLTHLSGRSSDSTKHLTLTYATDYPMKSYAKTRVSNKLNVLADESAILDYAHLAVYNVHEEDRSSS